MASVSTYLNFKGETAMAFDFYQEVFNTAYTNPPIFFGDIPIPVGMPPMDGQLKKMIIHVALPILGGHILRGTDVPDAAGFGLVKGNNIHINLEPDSRVHAEKLFNDLSAHGKIDQPLSEMFWGAYYGSCTDKFGVNWMFNCASKH